MNLTLLLEGAVVVIGLVLAGMVVYKSRKGGAKQIPWDKIRPILTDTYANVQEIKEAEKIGYQALEDYAVLYVRTQILKANFLSDSEKSLLTDGLIRSIIAPQLRNIYKELKK